MHEERRGISNVRDDGLLHWDDVRKDLYTEEERRETDRIVQLIGALVMRRKSIGLTQEELAKRTGLKQSAVARLESGNTVPKLDTLIRVADALDLNLTLEPKNDHGREEAAAMTVYS
ncbi:helix-turn-helix domain-containing protein [Alicyclobacillus macrosporangiidus]|uniref:Helix-turn-helix n=1 Tax=Alicyclobacillus macrosporangiidus TaxID=392015 RepID=A0A1I7L2E1_9BACL|nr:helix-turn-helix transcriptional regulator [Alicyclobacillus macrosporangiidus]SFV03805.1 Helix-turn-helix [Alicyclobacillus macrosporangiidus]